MDACPIRLLPSTNGWFMTSEKPKAAAFSTAVGYRFTPPKVMRGWAKAESRALGSRTPEPPPDWVMTSRCNSSTSSIVR